jgi:hypothetical protein
MAISIFPNMHIKVSKDDKITIVVDLKRRLGKSKSGKSNIIATTRGISEVPGKDGKNIFMAINFFEKV